jgi:hypothetical protein
MKEIIENDEKLCLEIAKGILSHDERMPFSA